MLECWEVQMGGQAYIVMVVVPFQENRFSLKTAI
jgi:hypothetical protein